MNEEWGLRPLKPSSNKPCLISASRRTDIPAFYGEWLMHRIREGWAVRCNPYNHRAVRVSLRPPMVGAFIFWSKNFQPFLQYLDDVDRRGYHCVFLYTITGLPRVFERQVPDTDVAVDTLKALSKRYSSKHVQWRYDPILLTNLTDPDFHIHRFRKLCRDLEGHTTRCYTSIANIYSKVKRRLEVLQMDGIQLLEVSEQEQVALAEHMADIAADHGISVYSCCNDHLISNNVKKGHCVDRDLLMDLFDLDKSLYSLKPTRKQCGCCESYDIGMYETCPHACTYCYANSGSKCISNYHNHDPRLPTLIADAKLIMDEGKVVDVEDKPPRQRQQSFMWD